MVSSATVNHRRRRPNRSRRSPSKTHPLLCVSTWLHRTSCSNIIKFGITTTITQNYRSMLFLSFLSLEDNEHSTMHDVPHLSVAISLKNPAKATEIKIIDIARGALLRRGIFSFFTNCIHDGSVTSAVDTAMQQVFIILEPIIFHRNRDTL